MTAGPRVLPPPRPARGPRMRRTGPSPLSLAGFAILVLALLAVVPIAGRDGGSDRAPTSAERQAAGRPAPGLGRVPVDEEVVVVAAGPPVSEPAPAQPASAGTVDLDGVLLAASVPPDAASVPSAAPTGATAATAAPAPDSVAPPPAGEADNGKGKAKAGKGTSRAERPGSGRGAAGGDVVSAALGPSGKGGPPGKADPPGRRRGHRR